MNQSYRTLISEAVIGLSLCIGAHFFLVAPAQRQLDETMVQILKIEAEQRLGEPVGITLTSEQAARMTEEARQINSAVSRYSLIAADDAALFQAVTALAERHKVRIDQLQPSQRVAAAAPAAPADPAAPAPPADSAVRCDIAAAGSYTSMAAFLADLSHSLGFTTINSVRIEPDAAGGPDDVIARVQTQHYWFETSDNPAASRPAAHAPAER